MRRHTAHPRCLLALTLTLKLTLTLNLTANLFAQVPNKEQVLALSEELRSRSALPAHVPAVLKALPQGTHPMTQFSTAVLALQARVAAAHKSRRV